MTTLRHLKLGKRTALISFIGGTLIFLLYYLTSADGLLFLGYGYIAIVGLINLIILINLLVRTYKDKDNRIKLATTCGLMLLNIPVMLLYCWFAIIILNTMRITFINTTSTELTDIKISGCEPKQIDKLASGQSQTVWVGITGDCSIDIWYKANGQPKHESVAGYCTNNMGQKITYKIGTDEKPVF